MITLDDIHQLDNSDELAPLRQQFQLPAQAIYLDGNSLGALQTRVVKHMQDAVEQQWGQDLITSWNKHGWIDLPEKVGAMLADLIGADRDEVVCTDSISVNLFKLLTMALALNPGRTRILSVRENFPTDLYVAQGLAQLLGPDRCEFAAVTSEELEQAMDDSVAVVLLSHVDYRSGQLFDLASITQKARDLGILTLWDLAHSAGVIPMSLSADGVDFAVGCTYKYLNGGPGAPGFAYVAKRHQGAAEQPIAGWMGHSSPFEFTPDYSGANNIRQLLSGTPPVLSMSALDMALRIYTEVSVEQLRKKSQALTECFRQLMGEQLGKHGFKLISPINPQRRGSQLAFSHPRAYAICQALIHQRVIGDFRAPDILRFGFAPLYNSFVDLWQGIQALRKVMEEKAYLQPEFNRRNKVT